MAPVRVLHVINSLDFGGAEVRTVSVINALDRRRFEPILVCLQNGGPLLADVAAESISLDLPVRSLVDVPKAISRLLNVVGRTQPQIVHTHLVQAGLVGRLAAQRLRVPITVSTQHNAYYPKQGTVLYRVERRTWALANGIIALSGAIELYLRDFGYRGSVRVIPTGVDPAVAESTTYHRGLIPGRYILSVGHFRDGQKGHDVLLKAFSLLLPTVPDVKLVIVGEGQQRQNMTHLAHQLGLEHCVMFMGVRDDVAVLMKGCALFALPSRWEGFGRVLVEAMSSGRPVVASAVEGIPEVVRHGETGLLVPPENATALAEAMRTVLIDDTVGQTMGRRAREVAGTHFSLHQMIIDISRFYDELLSRDTPAA